MLGARLDPQGPDEPEIGYFALVRQNTNFRRLWAGNVISLLGDWFNTIALYALVLELTGSEFALGAVFIAKMLPSGLASPIAGLVVDRFNRRWVMIGSNLIRSVIVLGFLLVDEPSEVPLIYALIIAQVVVGAVFRPAQNASIPNITEPHELLTANALMATTWSTILALGAGLGGFATELIGIEGVFIVDAATYLVSSWFIWRTRIPQNTDPAPRGNYIRTAHREVVEGWKLMRDEPAIGRIALAKATWAIGGGALLFMLALIGERISPTSASVAIGVLFSARGIGTGIGPIIARAVFKDRTRWPLVLGACVIASGICYALVGSMAWTYWIVVAVIVAHATSGANWVLSNVLLQERTPDRWRGRVFATEWLAVMTANSIAILGASLFLDTEMLDLRAVVTLFAGIQMGAGLLWIALVVPRERSAEIR